MHHKRTALRKDLGSSASRTRQQLFTSGAKYLFALIWAALIATSANAQKVTTDFDAQADFSKFKTYTWGEGRPARDPLIGQRIVDGVDKQLAAKGLRKAGQGELVDLIVVYQTATDTQTQINTYNSGYWGGWAWGGGMSQTTVHRIPVGELIVDLADVSQKRFVWRGRASGTISSKPEKVTKMLDKALTKMFENYPPRAKK